MQEWLKKLTRTLLKKKVIIGLQLDPHILDWLTRNGIN